MICMIPDGTVSVPHPLLCAGLRCLELPDVYDRSSYRHLTTCDYSPGRPRGGFFLSVVSSLTLEVFSEVSVGLPSLAVWELPLCEPVLRLLQLLLPPALAVQPLLLLLLGPLLAPVKLPFLMAPG